MINITVSHLIYNEFLPLKSLIEGICVSTWDCLGT